MYFIKTENRFNINRVASAFQRMIVELAVRGANIAGFPKIIPWCIAKGCRPIKGLKKNHDRKIWMLGKEGLTQDLLVSLKEGCWATPVDVSRLIPKHIAAQFLPSNIDDNNYAIADKSIDKAKMNYRQAWQEIFRNLPYASRPAAITTGNFGYYAEREMAHAAELEKIPFIAMHKECLKSDGRIKFFKTVYQRRGRFFGRKILVYNTRERDLQIESKVALPNQVVVCGMPRLDRLHHWRKKIKPERNRPSTLLAFSFTAETGLPRVPRKSGKQVRYEYLDSKHEGLGWHNFFHNYHELLVKIAFNNPSWVVQLKLKPRPKDYEPAIRLMKKLNAPDNLHVIVGGDPLRYITNADVVCGFNSTAVLEGLAAGLPVVTPMFDEAVDSAMKQYVAVIGSATYQPIDPPTTYKVLTELMSKKRRPQKKLIQDAAEALEFWVGNSDGRAGERVRQAFESEMRSHR